MWCHISIILPLGRRGQKHLKFKVFLSEFKTRLVDMRLSERESREKEDKGKDREEEGEMEAEEEKRKKRNNIEVNQTEY